MCVIFIAYRQHPNYELIVASNRDELHSRPTESAAFWEDQPQLLAGRDAVEWGTWLGVTKNGRFAGLTNYRQAERDDPTKNSRGQLVKDFLVSSEPASDYVSKIQAEKDNYNGFNLLVYDQQAMYYYSARQNQVTQLEPGVYGLSNAELNTAWPKVEKGVQRLKALLETYPDTLPEKDLFELLADREIAADDRLPDTGIGLEQERLVSPIFIHSPEYGTCSSTVLTMTRNGQVSFTERTFKQGQPFNDDAHFSFQLEEKGGM
ncbi:hypothetical protein BEP19_12120 [Ammoniphilus oxalaticus]|uniref:NRDE family protein n=1 Tax=Ammoniphilus oxalaticus TaxID=66863 RepID=A0A419SGR5_9BACL|nr:NRDE family protein [Ammoniphilus oxalaticus]RKD22970.1 hypothetical protein BEP19_12120 [Ammoniphilus oxalaticus]